MTDPILDRLLDLASARFGTPRDALDPDADLFEILDIDSLQAMDLVTDLEDAFDVEVPDYEVAEARTFRQVADVVRRRV